MKLEEDQNTNRMTESLKLFAEVTSSQWFKQTGVILFLNKDDLFRDKLPKSPLVKLFPEYTGSHTLALSFCLSQVTDDLPRLGGDDYESALKFIESKYKEAFGSADVLYTWCVFFTYCARFEKSLNVELSLFFFRVTCAIDTQNVERVFFSIRDTVFRRSLQSFM